MQIHCTTGIFHTNLIGELPWYGIVWFHRNGIANILSLANVKNKHAVTYDSSNGNQFMEPDGSTHIFKQSSRWLYYLNIGKECCIMNIVEDKKSEYTINAYKCATIARELQRTLGRPSRWDFINIIEANLLQNCPVTKQDILIAEDIFGPDIGALKGKAVHKTTGHVDTAWYNTKGNYIITKNVTISINIMFVNGTAFFWSLYPDK